MSRVVGLMVCGPGEADRYLEASLKEFKRLADDAVIVGNNTDEKTEALIRKYGYWFYRDDREWGVHQPSIKTDLLAKIGKLNPTVILPLDADEVFDGSFDRVALDRWSGEFPACYFYIVNLWNDENHHRKSLGFWNVRMFNWRPELGTQYQKKNLHCGLGPPWAYNYGSYIPFIVKHYGLMKPEDRKKKIARYEKYDPQARFKDQSYYDSLKYEGVGAPLEDITEQVRKEVSRYNSQKKTIHMEPLTPAQFVYMKRLRDGVVLEIPKRDVELTLKQGFEIVSDYKLAEPMKDAAEAPFVPNQCPICGFEAKTEVGLKKHKVAHFK